MAGPGNVQGTTSGGFPVFYYETYPDSEAATQNIITATTTLVVTGIAGQNIYLWYAAAYATNTNSGASFAFAYGPNSSTLTYLFASLPSGGAVEQGIPSSSGMYGVAYSDSTTTGVVAVVPAAIPRVIPAGQNLYFITSGTTVSAKGYALYAQH